MGTNETEKPKSEKQQQLENLLNRMRWKVREFTRRYCAYKEEEGEEGCNPETIRRAFTRRSISDKQADAYLEFIYSQPAFKNLDIIVPRYVSIDDEEDLEALKKMKKISKMITEELIKREREQDCEE